MSGQARAVPATIQAEDFDEGGEGVAYHDTDVTNYGGAYRATGVDIEASRDAGGGYFVGDTKVGEWLKYTVDVAAAGSYTLEARVASSGQGGTFHVEFGGVNKTGSLTVPNTGVWQTWRTLSVPVQLGVGVQEMRVVFDSRVASGDVGNLNWIKLTSTAPPTSPPKAPSGLTAVAAAGRVALAWADNATDETVYTVERKTGPAGTYSVMTSTLAAGTTAYTDTTVAADSRYFYRVRATNAVGGSAYSNEADVTTPAADQTSGDQPYGGHPLIPNLISISPSIAITDASGTVPFVVQVNAADTVATFSDGGAAFRAQVGRDFDPYLDLQYTWDFGDAAGAETLTHPVTGATVDANDDQSGPEAMYVYRSPGAYPITLTVRGWNSTAFVSASTTTLSVEEVQQFSVRGVPTGGTYTLSFGGKTTPSLAYNARADQIQAALEALPGIGVGNVESYGGPQPSSSPILVFFKGDLLGRPQPLLTANSSGLTGGTSPSIAIARVNAGSTASSATASPWSGQDRYFDSNYNGSKGASDGSFDRPYTTYASIRTWIQGGTNRRALLKSGSAWQVTSGIYLEPDNSGARIVSYGSGPRPKLYATTNIGKLVVLEAAHGLSLNDVVIDGLELSAGPSASAVFVYNSGNGDKSQPYGVPQGIYLLNDRFVAGASAQVHFSTPVGLAMGTWRSEFDAAGTTTSHGILAGMTRSFSVVGGSFAGGGSNLSVHHHIYPTIQSHSLYRWIDFRLASARNYAINGNVNTYATGGVDSRYHLIDGSNITGTVNGLDFSSTANRSFDPYIDQIIVQNSAIHVGQIGSLGYGILANNPRRLVVRSSSFYDNPKADIQISYNAIDSNLTAYRNTFRRSSTGASTALELSSFSGGYIRDNIITTARTASGGQGLIRYNSAELGYWKIDVNQYDAPTFLVEGQVKPFYDVATKQYKTFAEWQRAGADIHGSYGNVD